MFIFYADSTSSATKIPMYLYSCTGSNGK